MATNISLYSGQEPGLAPEDELPHPARHDGEHPPHQLHGGHRGQEHEPEPQQDVDLHKILARFKI